MTPRMKLTPKEVQSLWDQIEKPKKKRMFEKVRPQLESKPKKK